MWVANLYDVGDVVRCAALFTNAAGTAIDPTAVVFKLKNPAGTITTLTYGVDGLLLRLATGSYYVDVNADALGTWHYRFYSTGTGQSAEESFFRVESSAF